MPFTLPLPPPDLADRHPHVSPSRTSLLFNKGTPATHSALPVVPRATLFLAISYLSYL